MNVSTWKRLSALLILLGLAGCGPQLPESYGVYVYEKGNLVEIASNTYNHLNSGKISFLVFHRDLTNPLLPPEEALQLNGLHYVRGILESVAGPGDPPSIAQQNYQRKSWVSNAAKIPLRVSPVPENKEMLKLEPEVALSTGAYVFIRKSLNSNDRFSIGIGESNKTVGKAACADEHVVTKPKSGGSKRFSWQDWAQKTFALMEGTSSDRRSFNGRDVLKASFEPCSVVDKMADSWREELKAVAGKASSDSSDKDSLVALGRIADRLLSLNPEDTGTQEIAYEALKGSAEHAISKNQLEVAGNLASAAKKYKNTAEIQALIERAGQRQ